MYTLYYITSNGFPVSKNYETSYELTVALRAFIVRFLRLGIPFKYNYDKENKRAVVVKM